MGLWKGFDMLVDCLRELRGMFDMKIGEGTKGKKGKSGEECEASELPHQVGQSEEGAGRHDELLLAGKVKFKLQDVRCERWSGLGEEFVAALWKCGPGTWKALMQA